MSLRVELEPALEKEFRQHAMQAYGYSKGSLKKAFEVAVNEWVSERKIEKIHTRHPRTMRGILTKTKKGSVELEDEIKKIWVEKTLRD